MEDPTTPSDLTMCELETDEPFLERALEAARDSIGLTSPNPSVGAVIVNQQGVIVGVGSHTYDGRKHAEILALEQAGEQARGSTIYLNLEPCSHQGRTGPCAEAIIAAGLRRVVACMEDPNPEVRGRGFQKLRAAGIVVRSGVLEEQAKQLNEAFAKYIRHHTPLVTLKAAMTLDGKIAPPAGSSKTPIWITGDRTRAHAQELRHHNDAIMVGIGTVIADNPLLTDRTGRARRRPLLRVILDSRLRLPLQSQVVETANNDVLVLCSLAEEQKKKQLQQRGIRVEQIPLATGDGRPGLPDIVRFLGTLEITSVMIEGGAMVNGAALAANVVDKVFLYYAPRILAGTHSVPFAAGAGFQNMAEAAHVKAFRLHPLGEDFAVEGYLKDPYRD
jgi:diaminohydroxyphosphoribosylaminopyrimidine deaminase / 5-amino-6-(5-phosphoribosylamino)uracil reductase